MRKFAFVLTLALVAAPAAAQAQYEPGPRTPSIVRPAAMGGYDGGGYTGYGYGYDVSYGPGSHACSPHGCSRGICHGYDNCCLPCPTLLCCLKRIGCMLDCLLPCHCCKPSPCRTFGGGLFHKGGCGPHHFSGGRCCGPACDGACPTCTSHVPGPSATDPFKDDPLPAPPTPMPEATKDARRHPIWNTPAPTTKPASPALSASAAVNKRWIGNSPYKLAGAQPAAGAKATSKPAPVVMTSRRTAQQPLVAPVSVAANEPISARPEAQSVLRRLSHEEAATGAESEPSASIPSPPLPSLLPIQFNEAAATNLEIPRNPLRR